MAKILLIDDDPLLVEHMQEFIKMEGHDVITAASGEEGFEKAKSETPDLVILDVMLPGIDGFDVARDMHKAPATKNIPILMLTGIKNDLDVQGFDFEKFRSDSDWLPVTDFCDKPVQPNVLIEKVNKLLEAVQASKS